MSAYLVYKIVVVGAPNTGKTTFLRYQTAPSRQPFEYSTTLGFNLAVEDFTLARGIECKFQLWELADSPRFRAFYPHAFKGVKGCLLFFDTSNLSSFQRLTYWITVVRKYCLEIPVILIGTKIDLRSEVTYDEATSFANAHHLEGCFLISTLSDLNKKEILRHLAKKIVDSSSLSLEQIIFDDLPSSEVEPLFTGQ